MRLTSLCKIRCEAEKTKLNRKARVNPDLQRKAYSKSISARFGSLVPTKCNCTSSVQVHEFP